MYYVGLMSGTSADAIDAVVMQFPADESFRLIGCHHQPLPEALQAEIHALTAAGPNELERAGALSVRLGRLFAQAALAAIAQSGIEKRHVRAVGCHGQTIRHKPGGTEPFTVQIGEPAIVAEETGITTVAHFRARDLAAGGQGAPLVPAFHRAVFWSDHATRAIVNIGGIANVTILPKDREAPVTGFDVGPGNTLMDQWVKRHRGMQFDHDGTWARSGRVQLRLLQRFLDDPYFRKSPPKSTGRELFNMDWVLAALRGFEPIAPEDIQATLLELTAASIANVLTASTSAVDEVYLCGGGARNQALVDALGRNLSPLVVQTTEALGLTPQWVEAGAFAWLARCAIEGETGNLPSVTGARHPVVLGAIYPA